jgi:hypothetical protein
MYALDAYATRVSMGANLYAHITAIIQVPQMAVTIISIRVSISDFEWPLDLCSTSHLEAHCGRSRPRPQWTRLRQT